MTGSPGFFAGRALLAGCQGDEYAGYRCFAQGKAMAATPGGSGVGDRQNAAHDTQQNEDHDQQRDEQQDRDRGRGFDRVGADRSDDMPGYAG